MSNKTTWEQEQCSELKLKCIDFAVKSNSPDVLQTSRDLFEWITNNDTTITEEEANSIANSLNPKGKQA